MNIYCQNCPAHAWRDEYRWALAWSHNHTSESGHHGFDFVLPEDL